MNLFLLSRLTPLLLVATLSACALPAIAQDAAEAVTTLSVTTRLVLLDTTVTDAQGKPVLGLTAKDFQVFEQIGEGRHRTEQEQRIVSFDTPTAHTLPPTVTRTTVFDPADPTPFGSSPVNLLVLDEVNTHFSDVAYGVHSLIEYLRARPETLNQPTAVIVVRDSRFEQIAPFTLDRDKLIAALKSHVPEQAWQLEQSMSIGGEGVATRLDLSLSALEQLVQFTARIPGHKNIVWVGAGFPTPDPDALTLGTNATLQHMLRHVTDVLLDARATLYAIDPTTTLPTQTEITDPVQLEFAAAAGGGGRVIDPFDKTLDFDRLGPVTGGKVIRGHNEIEKLVDENLTAGSTYYTIGYRPTGLSTESAQFRHIRVVCLRPGLTATTHDGYYPGAAPAGVATETIGYDLNNAATATVPFNAIAFTIDPPPASPHLSRLDPPDAYHYSPKSRPVPAEYTLHARAADLAFRHLPGDPEQKATAEVLVVALDAKGKVLAHTLHTEVATTSITNDTRTPDRRVRFTVALAPPPKATHLRFILRDQANGRMGTLDLPLHP